MELKTCKICGNTFERPLRANSSFKISLMNYHKRIFCSNKCRGIWHSQTFIGSKNANYRGGKTKCLDCGKELAARYSFRSTVRCKSCSHKLLKGEKSPNWRGGYKQKGSICKICGNTTSHGYNRCTACYHKTHFGVNSPVYKEKLKYSYLHDMRIKKYGNPPKCSNCGLLGKKNGRCWNIQWANKTGKYLRDNSDWLALCASCHRIYDIKHSLIKSI